MLTENEVCYAAFLYVNGLLNATKSLSVTEWLTFVAKDHYDHCTLSSKLFESNLHVLCTIPLCPSQLAISAFKFKLSIPTVREPSLCVDSCL